MKVKVVIGANFGDEGKGLITDYFASQSKRGIIVRFNGGAQAGHTVVDPCGNRHVFSHFGSGTIAGLPTYLTKHFIVNPILFMKEFYKLEKFYPRISIHPEALVTTPYDMMINQIVEVARSGKRHGSCGMGINETLVRSRIQGITYSGLFNSSLNLLRDTLKNIRKEYVPNRLRALGVDSIPLDYAENLYDNGIIEQFFSDVEYMKGIAKYYTTHGALEIYDEVIFEGAQGLMLDKNNDAYFPHLTPSNTGMQNVAETLNSIGNLINSPVEITYSTRCYMTRHGAGRFDTELSDKPYKHIVDLTNVSNPYQGSIRYGLLDIDSLKDRIFKDIIWTSTAGIPFNLNLAVTCLDQIGDDICRYRVGGAEYQTHRYEDLIFDLFRNINPKNMFLSYGMTRETIKSIDRYENL